VIPRRAIDSFLSPSSTTPVIAGDKTPADFWLGNHVVEVIEVLDAWWYARLAG
jgi:hypothetical protein